MKQKGTGMLYVVRVKYYRSPEFTLWKGCDLDEAILQREVAARADRLASVSLEYLTIPV